MPQRKTSSRVQRLQEDLKSASEQQEYTRLVRRWNEAQRIDGFIVGVGTEWALVAKQTDGREPNGWELIRIKLISEVLVDASADNVDRRILVARGHWPPPSMDLNLDDDHELLAQLADEFPIVTFHTEKRHPDMMWVGSICSTDDEFVYYHSLDPDAEWHEELEDLKIRQLSRITVGDDYQGGLLLVAGPRPKAPGK